jgi:uncharacterized BrkB/YihY/UPF0761 family membrane protein
MAWWSRLSGSRDRLLPGSARERWRAAVRHVPAPARRLASWARSDEALLTSASLSFYALMSLPPMVLVAFWAIGAVAGDGALQAAGQSVAHWLPRQLRSSHLPGAMVDVASAVGWVSVVLAVWPATWYGAGLSRALDRITGERSRRFDGVRGRALGLLFVLLLPLGVLAALLAAFLAPGITGHGPWAYVGGVASGGVLGLLIVTGVVAVVYELFSPRDVRWRETLAGAGLAALLMAVVSALFVVYLRLGANYNQRYATASLAAAALFALWLYLVHTMLLVGYRHTMTRARRRREEAGQRGRAGGAPDRGGVPEGSHDALGGGDLAGRGNYAPRNP